MTKRVILKILPYICACIVGITIYLISLFIRNKLRDLLINISASFLSIPLLLLFYDMIKESTNKKLNKEIFDYSKTMVDSEILNCLNQISKMIYPLEKETFL